MWQLDNSWYFNAHQLIKPWEQDLKMILRQMLVTPLKEEKKHKKAKEYFVKLESYFSRWKKMVQALDFALHANSILNSLFYTKLHSTQFNSH